MLFHAELDTDPTPSSADVKAFNLYNTFLESRPQKLETDAITLITALQRVYPALRCHIVHLSAASALPLVQTARSLGLNITVETCFHYLCLSSEDIPAGRTEFKSCPPIRESANNEALWDALQAGLIDFVVSDHSPCIAELKKADEGDIMGAWGGISTLGLGLSLLWTEAEKRGLSIAQVVDWTSTKTAKHAGLGETKGQIAAGYDGDLIVWDPLAEFKVHSQTSRRATTPNKRVLRCQNKLSTLKTNSHHTKG